jgi:hypothetical protein
MIYQNEVRRAYEDLGSRTLTDARHKNCTEFLNIGRTTSGQTRNVVANTTRLVSSLVAVKSKRSMSPYRVSSGETACHRKRCQQI